MSLAASGSMTSSLGRTASDTPVRDDGEGKSSDSGGQMLVCARKSRPAKSSGLCVKNEDLST